MLALVFRQCYYLSYHAINPNTVLLHTSSDISYSFFCSVNTYQLQNIVSKTMSIVLGITLIL